ncbi:MAG: DJ-1/PfpI family protein, partial [Oscillospiraceae bacterium]
LLNGKHATCFPGFEEFLEGAVLSEKKVVTDGLITTAAGAGPAIDFGLELVRVLKGQVESDRIRAAIQCAN